MNGHKQNSEFKTRLYNAREIQIYTDGGCKPNPGAGGFGVVVLDGPDVKEYVGGFRRTTNNRMEIYAAIYALEMLGGKPCRALLHSDSEYLVRPIEEGWAKRWKANGWWRNKSAKADNADLWERLLGLLDIHQIKFNWVKGHDGNAWNERCDQLASKGRNMPSLPADEGYREAFRAENAQLVLNLPCPKKSTKWWAIVEVEGKKDSEYIARYMEADWDTVQKIVSGTPLKYKGFPNKEEGEAWVRDVLPGQVRKAKFRERVAQSGKFDHGSWSRANINTKFHRGR